MGFLWPPCSIPIPMYVMNVLFGGVYWRFCSYSTEAV